MAEYRIEVVVAPEKAVSGAKRVEKSMEDLEKRANKTRDAIAASLAPPDTLGGLEATLRRLGSINGGVDAALGGLSRQLAGNMAAAQNEIAAATRRSAAETDHFGQVVLDTSRKARGAVDDAAISWDGWTSKADKAAASANRMGNLVQKALAVAPYVAAAAALASLSDTYTTLQNRLGTVESATHGVADMSDRLFTIAQNTRSEWTSVSEVFVRTSGALKGLGYSTEQTLSFTETLSKAVKLSGASATEANAAMIQLSQGLASGTLRGDELNSVLEQLPTVADVIADHFGVTRGALRKMGEEGKISAGDIISAFDEAKGDIDGKFGKVIPTIGEQFTKLKNIALKAVGDLMPVLGPMIDLLGVAVGAIGKVISTAAEVVGAVGTVLDAGSAVDTAEIKYGDFGKTLGAVVAEFPKLSFAVVDLGIAVEGTDERVYSLTGQLQKAATTLTELKLTVGEITAGMGQMQTATALAFAEFAKANANEAKRIIDLKLAVDGLRDSVDPSGAAMRKLAADTLSVMEDVSLGIRSVDEGRAILEGLAKATTDIVGKDAAAAADKARDAFEQLLDRVSAYRDEVHSVGAAQTELTKIESDLEVAVRRHKITEEEALDIYERKAFAMRDQLDPMGAVLEGIRKETAALKLSDDARAHLIEREAFENTLRQAGLEITLGRIAAFEREIALRDQAKADKDSRDQGATDLASFGTDVFKKQDASFDKASAKTAKDAANEAREATKELKVEAKELAVDFGQSFDGIYRNATDVAGAVANAWTNAFSSMENAFVSFVTTGKVDFASLTKSILADISRILFKQALVGLFGRPGDANGQGAVSGLFGVGGFPGFATGGSFTVGGNGGTDTTPVMFRATPGERVIVQTPAQQAAASAPAYMPAPVVNNQIVIDHRTLVQALSSPGGKRAIVEVVRANPHAFQALLR